MNKTATMRTLDLDMLLPHRPPMRLIDEIVEASDEAAKAQLTIRPDSLFFEAPRGVPAWVGIEFMAQTVGVVAGMQAHLGQWELTAGYLLSARRYRTEVAWFEEGLELIVAGYQEMMGDSGLGAFRCTIACSSSPRQILATCGLTIYRNPPPRSG